MKPPRLFTRCLLRPSDIPPSQDDLKVVGVTNPGATAVGDGAVLLVRVTEVPAEERPGWVGLPRWDASTGRVLVRWVPDEAVTRLPPHSVRFNDTGRLRLTQISHLCVVRSADGRSVERVEPIRILPKDPLEDFGVEDARITLIGDTHYITYVAVSEHGPATALASTKDFRSFERHGIIFPPDNRDVVLFSEKIGDRFHAIHRPCAASPLTRPEMWLGSSPNLLDWGRHCHLHGCDAEWEGVGVGGGAPPILTDVGWLLWYYGADSRNSRLSGGLLLLDNRDPCHIRGHSIAVFAPELDFERDGPGGESVKPTGVIRQGQTLLVYYGAADRSTAVTEFRLGDLLATLKR